MEETHTGQGEAVDRELAKRWVNVANERARRSREEREILTRSLRQPAPNPQGVLPLQEPEATG